MKVAKLALEVSLCIILTEKCGWPQSKTWYLYHLCTFRHLRIFQLHICQRVRLGSERFEFVCNCTFAIHVIQEPEGHIISAIPA